MSESESRTEFEDLADQFAAQIRRGETPKVDEFASQNPHLASQIERLFPVLEMMERGGAPVDDLSESGLLEAEMKSLKSLPPIRRLGDYRIVREIGRGGMGIVFEAQQESLDRRVALKLLPDSAQLDARRQERFQLEARASAMLHHTNIVPIFGIGTHQSTSYFVMQYIDGQPLDHVIGELSKIRSGNSHDDQDGTVANAHADVSTIATMLELDFPNPSEVVPESNSQADSSKAFESDSRDGNSDQGRKDDPELIANRSTESKDRSTEATDSAMQLSDVSSAVHHESSYWRSVAKLGIQVSSALEHAHSRKILHRDIKPSNLMIDLTGRAWVTDFGLAKYFESPKLTRTGEVVGTLRYMSPEQLNGKTDERSDIFALGLTLYELAGLKPAYDATDRNLLMKQAIEAAPIPLRSVDKRIPKDLETIVHKCIAVDPNGRYQNAESLTNDLRRYLEGEPIQARRVGPVERVVKWCRRRPAIAMLLAALALSLIAGISGIAWQWKKTEMALIQSQSNLSEAELQKEKAQKNLEEANRQKRVAKDHFKQARDSVRRFFLVVSQQRLLSEPGFLNLRKDLFEEALQYHKQFVAQYGDDDALKFELGTSLYQIAEIEGSLSGDPRIADSLDEPIQIFTDLIESENSLPAYKVWLARCIGMKARLVRRADAKKSLEYLVNSVETLEEIQEEFPDSEEWLEDLSVQYQILGLSYESLDRATRRTERALDSYMKSFAIRTRLCQSYPENLKYAIQLAEINRDLGVIHRMMGQPEKTIEFYDTATGILEPLVQEHPGNMNARKSLGSICNSIGFFYGLGPGQAEYTKALSYYEKSREHYLALANANPLVVEYQDGLARASLNSGGVYQVQGKLDKAFECRSYAANIRKRLCEINPEAPYLRSSWAVSMNGVGATLRELGKFDESIAKHAEAHEQHLKVVNMDPTQTILRLRLIDGLVQSARTHSAAKQFSKAIESVNAIREFTLETFSQPHYTMGRELTLIACKIGQLPDDERSNEIDSLKATSLEAAKEVFQVAAQRGYSVVDSSQRDTVFKNFLKYPECQEIADWLESEFGEQ